MYVKENGRKIRYIQKETAASTAANVVGTGQATTNMRAGDFCTIMCTTGRMFFRTDVIGEVMTSTSQNGWEMISGDAVDFVANSSFIYTLSTGATSGKFQLIVWES